MKTTLPKILTAPVQPSEISDDAKWLSGEGAGSWFVIVESEMHGCWEVTRYSPEGNLECRETFTSKYMFDLKQKYTITYPSHCAKVTIEQNNQTIQLTATLT